MSRDRMIASEAHGRREYLNVSDPDLPGRLRWWMQMTSGAVTGRGILARGCWSVERAFTWRYIR